VGDVPACHRSEYSVLPEQAGPRAGRRKQCGGVPGADRPFGTVVPFRR
jgi:hypothetical protein